MTTAEADLLKGMAKLEERSVLMHEDMGEVRASLTRLEDRVDDTRDLAISAKRNGTLAGVGTSGGLIGLIEAAKAFIAS